MRTYNLIVFLLILFLAKAFAEDSLDWFEKTAKQKRYTDQVAPKLKQIDKKDRLKALSILSNARHNGIKASSFRYLSELKIGYKNEDICSVAWKYMSFEDHAYKIDVLKFLIEKRAEGVEEKTKHLYANVKEERAKLRYLEIIIDNRWSGWTDSLESFLNEKGLSKVSVGSAIIHTPLVYKQKVVLRLTDIIKPLLEDKRQWGTSRICDLAASRLASLYPMFSLELSEEDRKLIYGDKDARNIWNKKLSDWIEKNKNTYAESYKKHLHNAFQIVMNYQRDEELYKAADNFKRLLKHDFNIKGKTISLDQRMDIIKKELSSWWAKYADRNITEIISSSLEVKNKIDKELKDLPG